MRMHQGHNVLGLMCFGLFIYIFLIKLEKREGIKHGCLGVFRSAYLAAPPNLATDCLTQRKRSNDTFTLVQFNFIYTAPVTVRAGRM